MRPSDNVPLLFNRRLRYVLVLALHDEAAPLAVSELVEIGHRHGCSFPRRPSQLVSDVLRSEARKGRVVVVDRGVYRVGRVARSTVWWMRESIRADDEHRARLAA
jgi:hypothetical protein